MGLPLTALAQLPRVLGKGEERKHLKKTQDGQGTGASLARQSGQQATDEAMSIAAAGTGPSKAFAAREGMRQARESRRSADQNAAIVGAQEGLQATGMLRDSDIARRAAIGQLGAAGGGALAAMDAQQQAASDQTFQVDQAQKRREHELDLARMMGGTQATPTVPAPEEQGEGAQAQPAKAAPIAEQGQQGLEYIQALRDPKVRFAIGEGMGPEEAVAEFFPNVTKPVVGA